MNKLIDPGIPEFYQALLCDKYPHISDSNLTCMVNEILKFFHMAAATERSFSYPISALLDDIVHLFILQTKIYTDFCARFRQGWRLEHVSNLSYMKKDPRQTRNETLSWMASYVENFGPFTLETLPHWPRIYAIYRDLKVPLEVFNVWCASLKDIYPSSCVPAVPIGEAAAQ